jgi:CRISPR-associated endonuclease Cas1 subtype II
MFILGWRSVIITQHAKLSYSSHMMIVQTNDGINQIPIDDISILLISTTRAVITTALISELAQVGTKVIFTDGTNQPICETVGYYPNNRSVKLLQEQVNWDEQRKEVLWTKIVGSKMTNQVNVLAFYKKDTTEVNEELDKLEVADPSNREAVVARKYFPLLFNNDFSRRNGSAINSALDYGYSILLSSINQEIVSNGYLTYIGIHHRGEENPFNLGSDLMEPFRPVVDFWIASQKFDQLTPDVKYGLVQLLSMEIGFNGKSTLLKNALTEHVRNCLKYLSGKSNKIQIEVGFRDEVPNNAINDNV